MGHCPDLLDTSSGVETVYRNSLPRYSQIKNCTVIPINKNIAGIFRSETLFNSIKIILQIIFSAIVLYVTPCSTTNKSIIKYCDSPSKFYLKN